jgi:hypothetical protein
MTDPPTLDRAKARPTSKTTRKPRWKSNLAISILIIILLATGIGFWTTQNYLWRIPPLAHNSPPKALIIDQLSLNYPDPGFVTNITAALTGGGYRVDYSGPITSAVDFFRQLPNKGYDLIIIRAHQGGDQSIITSEPYTQSQYLAEQTDGALVAAEVGGVPSFFALTPKFVRQDMQGRFQGSTIVVMGCAALQGTQELASAFLDRGASFFVGWNDVVTIIHTDTTTVTFAQNLASGKSVPDATRIAGVADPVYGARLQYLTWNGLVQGRIDQLKAGLEVWFSLGAILIFGPLAALVVPKVFWLLDLPRKVIKRRGKTSRRPESRR